MFEKSPNLQKEVKIESPVMNTPGSRLRIRITPRIFDKIVKISWPVCWGPVNEKKRKREIHLTGSELYRALVPTCKYYFSLNIICITYINSDLEAISKRKM